MKFRVSISKSDGSEEIEVLGVSIDVPNNINMKGKKKKSSNKLYIFLIVLTFFSGVVTGNFNLDDISKIGKALVSKIPK